MCSLRSLRSQLGPDELSQGPNKAENLAEIHETES